MGARRLASPLGGRLALVADGNSHTAELYARGLRSEGVGVLVAESCRLAVALVDAHAFDLLVIDHDLPGGGALQVLARLGVGGRHAHSRSIVCGSDWTAPDRWMALLCGASVVLHKPVRSADLLDRARSLLPYKPRIGIALG